MQKYVLSLAAVAGLAISSAAQSRSHSAPVSTRLGNDPNISGHSRPRTVPARAASVKSSVILSAATAERIAFDVVNQKRAERGLHPLAWNNDIASIARVHSRNMADLSFFSHRGLDNKMVSDRAEDHGVLNWRSIGENIAYNRGYQDPVAKAVDLWLDSPGHRRNLLSGNWTDSAIGVAIARDGSYYFTQVFWVRQ